MPSIVFMDNGKPVKFQLADGETPEHAFIRYDAYKLFRVRSDDEVKALAEQDRISEKDRQYLTPEEYAKRPVVGRAAAIGAGMADFARNIGNMVGAIGDEEVNEKTARDAPLEKAYPGMHTLGQAAPAVLAGAGAAAIPGVGAAMAAHPYIAAAAQGAISGAAAGNPNERALPAALGAVTAPLVTLGLNKAVQATGKGLAPMSERAKEYVSTLRKMDPEADSYLPVAMAANKQGTGSSAQRFYETVLPMHGPSDRMLQQQMGNAENAAYKALLNQGYGKANAAAMMNVAAPKGANVARLDKALALSPLPKNLSGGGAPTRLVLTRAAQAPNRLGTPTFSQIGDEALKENLSRQVPAKTLESLKDLTYGISELSKSGFKSGSSVTDRATAYALFHKVVGAASIAGWGAIGGAARGLASRPFQNFLLGNTAVQRQIAGVLERQGPEAAVAALTRLAANYEAAQAGSAPEAVVQGVSDAVMRGAAVPAKVAEYSVPGVAMSQGAKLLRDYK